MNRRPPSQSWLIIVAGLVLVGVAWMWLMPSSAENPARQFIDFPTESPARLTSSATQDEPRYLGPQACAECHPTIYQSFLETSHAKTSAAVVIEKLQKILPANPHRVVLTPNLVQLELEIRPQGVYQTAVATSGQSRFDHTEQFDIEIGSGKMGHTYLFWKGSHLYQLPVGYVSITNEWRNSPNFPNEFAAFSRPIDARCLECHATFAHAAPDELNLYDRDSIVFGVSCETCHGPAQKHVEHHRANPHSGSDPFIVNPAKLPRARQIDVCSLCHAGGQFKDLLTKPFSFRPGEPLKEHIKTMSAQEAEVIGPHSNDQFLRISRSRCYQESDRLVCATCHNPHMFERNNTALFSKRCQTCHAAEACGKSAEVGDLIRTNCIDCHMRKAGMELHALGFFAENTAAGATLMRDHWIRVPQGTADGANSLLANLAPQATERLKQLKVDFEVNSAGAVQRVNWPTELPTRELVLLRMFDKLQELDLSEQPLDQMAWDNVLQLKQLRRLRLSKTGLTSRHVQQLTRLSRIRRLDLSDCPLVTDEVLSDLESFVVLESVDLRGTSVSPQGIERLRFNRPGCDIRF